MFRPSTPIRPFVIAAALACTVVPALGEECSHPLNWTYTWGTGAPGSTCHYNCSVPIGSCFTGCGTTKVCSVVQVTSTCTLGKLKYDENNQLVCVGNNGSATINATAGVGAGQCPCEA